MALCLAAVPAFAAPPSVTHLFPAGVERGKIAGITATGTFERWPVEIWLDRPGVKVWCDKDKGKLNLEAAADATPGVYWLRLFDFEGAAAVRPVVVGTLPELTEKEPNDRSKEAQSLTAPAMTINGQLGARGDVDLFAVEVRQGETLVASMQANGTLGSPMDASLQILSPDGFVLAQNDDDAGLDPRLAFVAPTAGRYLVRTFAFPAQPDSSINFAGDPKYVYRLTITTGGFIDHPFPLAVQRGGSAETRPGGWNLKDAVLTAALPEPAPLGPAFGREELATVWRADLAGLALAQVAPHAAIAEQEPNEAAKPQSVTAPVSVSGRLTERGDVDAFRIEAKKGARFDLRVASREIGSLADPVLKVLAADGKQLASFDDEGRESRDPSAAFAAPADGAYTVTVSDLHRRGGERLYYLLTILPAQPGFSLSVPAESFALTVGKPLEIALTVNREAGFADEIEITAEGLPTGVTAKPVKSLPKDATAKAVKLVLEASDAAKPVTFTIVGRGAKEPGLVRPARAALAGLDTATLALWLTTTKPAEKSADKPAEKAPEKK